VSISYGPAKSYSKHRATIESILMTASLAPRIEEMPVQNK
jgi:hypothetical protein